MSPEHITQQNEQLHENVTAQHHFNSDPLETCSGNDIATYQAIRSSVQLWNASDLVFGSFHQNDVRFSEQSRGYQCTCNALCILSFSLCLDVDNSLMLDKVLCEGDALYQTVISNLKTDGKFVQQLLSLEEIPDDFEVEIGKFTIEKFEIKSGPLIDAQDLGLPTLHEVLQSAFLSVSSGLLTIGAICSAVFKKNGLYVFFDSHSHGENGLSSSDGASSLITFSNLNDLVTYLYAFYDSIKLDTYLQFDFLPMNVRKCEDKQSYKDDMASHMEAYFNDQRLKQAMKTQSNVRSIPYDLSSVSIKRKERSFALSIIKTTEDNLDKTQRLKQMKLYIKENQRDLQERMLCLNPKKLCIRRNQSNQKGETLFLGQKKLFIRGNQSNQKGETLFLGQKKKNQSNQKGETLFLGQKKLFIRGNQSNQKGETLFLGQKKLFIRGNQSNQKGETLFLGQKKENQSNQKGETLILGQKKENQSNQKGETLILGQNKENQSNQKGETLILGQKKENRSNQKGETLFLGQKEENQSS